MSDAVHLRITRLESRLRSIGRWNFVLVFLVAMFALDRGIGLVARAQSGDSPTTITVAEIKVIDENGTVRARLGGDLPDGVIQGKRVRRGEKVAGLMLYDDTGQERGGYVTGSSGNIFLTLDTLEKQAALFAAGRSGGSALKLWLDDDLIDIRVDENGPSIHAMQNGDVAFHEPPVRNPAANQFCRALSNARDRATEEQLWEACRRRTSEEACQSCLGHRVTQ